MTHIMPEHQNDAVAIEALLERAFGKARHRKTVQKMRKAFLPSEGLAFVMTDDFDTVIGTIRLWDIEGENGARTLLLGPVAVANEYRGQGLGDALIRHSLAQAQKLGHKGVILVGDASYYGRFGFTRDLTLQMKLPGPVDEACFLGLELVEGGLKDVTALLNITGTLRPKAQPKRKAA
ncbi:MAG: N-acetyltransferase [Pseudomonadota bacterium]